MLMLSALVCAGVALYSQNFSRNIPAITPSCKQDKAAGDRTSYTSPVNAAINSSRPPTARYSSRAARLRRFFTALPGGIPS